MTREQAVNYLKSSGMSAEQIGSVADAFSKEGDNDMIMYLTKKEKELIYRSLHSRTVDVMRQINDTYITTDPDEAEDIRDRMYDEMDELEDLLDRFAMEI